MKKNKEKKIGLDWFDEKNLFSCNSYESLQIFLLCNNLLPDFFLESETKKSNNEFFFTAKIDTQKKWTNGNYITANEIIYPLQKVLKSKSLISQILLHNIQSLSLEKDKLAIELHAELDTSILRLPFLTPKKKNEFHKMKLIHKTSEFLHFSPNQHLNYDSEDLVFFRIRDPLENFNLYRMGYLDCVCDTAFPFDMVPFINESIEIHNTGLYMILRFGNDFICNKSFRIKIYEKLKTLKLPSYLNGLRSCMNNLTCSLQENILNENKWEKEEIFSPHLKSDESLSLVYDDYYPNSMIAFCVKGHLEQAGYKINLVRKKFEDKISNFDLKLEILCGKINSKYMRYFMMCELETLRQEKEIFNKYCRLLFNFLFEKTKEQKYFFNKMEKILDENAIYFPVCFIPSISIGNNPFVLGLSEGKVRVEKRY